jgi:hypothetical protein
MIGFETKPRQTEKYCGVVIQNCDTKTNPARSKRGWWQVFYLDWIV